MRNVFSVGLTGGIASGKSIVASIFAEFGIAIIDTDLIAHALTAPGGDAVEAIRAQFGANFIDATGAMDRPKMRELVFAEQNAKSRLEHILHPMIWDVCERKAEQVSSPYCIFVVPLLVESKRWRQRTQRILVVDCELETQLKRLITRSSLTQAQAKAIIKAQATRTERLAQADDIIDSEVDLSLVHLQVAQLHQKYLQFAL